MKWSLCLVICIFSVGNCQNVVVNLLMAMETGNTAVKQILLSALQRINVENRITVNHQSIEIPSNPTYQSVCDQFSNFFAADSSSPVVVLDTTNKDPQSSIVKRVTRKLMIPTLSASYGRTGDIVEWNNLTNSEAEYLVQIMPPGDIIAQIIHDIGASQNLTNAGILYDDSFNMQHQYKSILVNLPVRQIMQRVKPLAELKNQVLNYKMNGIVNFFVFGSASTTENILNIACKNELIGDKHAWFIISKSEMRITVNCDNIMFLSIYPEIINKDMLDQITRAHNIRGEVDTMYYYEITRLVVSAVASEMKKNVWNPINPSTCSSTLNPASPAAYQLRTALNLFLHETPYGKIMLNSNGKSFIELQMKIDEYSMMNTTLHVQPAGTWVAGMPGMFTFNRDKSLNSYLAKKIYKIVTVETAPFIIKKVRADGSVYFDGYCMDLLHEIQKIIKFKYEIYESPDGAYGAVNDSGQWNGMIRELIDKKADIALAPISVMAERENVVDFTVPYYDLVGITILMKKPKQPTSLFKFLNVLEMEVWLCILAAYFITSILMFLFDRWSPYSFRNNEEVYINDDENRQFNIKECLWFCMTSLTPQGGGEAPKNLSGRLVAATWWLFGFIVIASYTANLAAFLTVSRLDSAITSLDDLAKQYKFQYAPSEGTSTMTYFQRMADIESKFYEIWKDMSLNESMDEVERAKLAVWDYPVSDRYTRIWNAIKQSGMPKDAVDGVKRIRTSDFAYIGDATEINWAVLTECDFQPVGEEFSRKPYAIAVQKDSPLRDQFSGAILQLLNIRTLETLKEKWWDKNPLRKNCDSTESMSDGISIANIGGVFIVIFIGIGLASFALIFEYIHYRKDRRPVFSASNKTKVIKIAGRNEDLLSYKH